MSNKEQTILESIEKEALATLTKFKEHPIRTIVIAMVIIWFVKKIINFIKGE